MSTLIRGVRRVVHAANLALPAGPDTGVCVLTYHLIGGGTGTTVDLSESVFRTHLEQLQSHFEVCSLRSALEYLGGPPRSGIRVVLTFDDAYRNFHERAWPILERLRLPAVLYAPHGFVAGTAPSPLRGAEGLPACTWSQLRELVASGLIEVGSHSLSHRDLGRATPAELEREVVSSRRALEDELRVPVDSFCYPRGRTSTGAERLVTATYRSAVVGGGGRIVQGAWSPHRLPRLPLRVDTPSIVDVVRQRVWLEESVASVVRQFRRPPGNAGS